MAANLLLVDGSSELLLVNGSDALALAVQALSGSGTITATSSLTGEGGRGAADDGAITSTGTLTVTGGKGGQGAGTITAGTALTGSGSKTSEGAAPVSTRRPGSKAADTWDGRLVIRRELETHAGAGRIDVTATVTGDGIAHRQGGFSDDEARPFALVLIHGEGFSPSKADDLRLRLDEEELLLVLQMVS